MAEYTINLFPLENFQIGSIDEATGTVTVSGLPLALRVYDEEGIVNSDNPGQTTTVEDFTFNGQVIPAGSAITLYQAVIGMPGEDGVRPALYLIYVGDALFGTVSGIDLSDPAGRVIPYLYTEVLESGIVLDLNEVVICFAAGTEIMTASGLVRVEDLRVGDLVQTADRGLQPIRWTGKKSLSPMQLNAKPKLRPIRIRAGALGESLPSSDLVVSPQHRILVRSKIAQTMFGTSEVLVAAKQLLALDGVEIAEDLFEVDYHHFLFDQHEVVLANGAECESLFTGAEALKAVGPNARQEILTLFPELLDLDYKAMPARDIPAGRLARKLAERHVKNLRPLVA